jgi:hypothetical protein
MSRYSPMGEYLLIIKPKITLAVHNPAFKKL